MKSEEFVNRSYRAMSSMDPFCLFDSCLSLSLSFLMINVFFRNRYNDVESHQSFCRGHFSAAIYPSCHVVMVNS